jgi:hypothetical protein
MPSVSRLSRQMWEPRHLTILWGFTACYRDSFTLLYDLCNWDIADKYFYFHSFGGGDWVHLVPRPLFALLYQFQMVDVYKCGAVGGMRIGRGNRNTRRKPARASLYTTNPTWPVLGSNPDRRVGKPTTSRLSYGTAKIHPWLWSKKLHKCRTKDCSWKDE